MKKENLPQHIAIIMDGNGRWAKKRRLPRIMGHRKGMETAFKITKACVKLGIKVLTLYAFSTENWKRPKEEVNFLMELLKEALEKYKDSFEKYDMRLQVIGEYKDLPEEITEKLEEIMESTKEKRGMVLNIALNYGGRTEIIKAVREIANRVIKGEISPDEIDESLFSNFLYTKNLLEPDLLIRTAGELRISNFLLWQISYTELYFTKKFWPDFTVNDLKNAIKDFQKRERRFGSVLENNE